MKRKSEIVCDDEPSSKKQKWQLEPDLHLDYFKFLPDEIISLILSHLQEHELNRLRLVNEYFFYMIDKSLFRLGCLLPSEIESVVKCFARYQRPIGLKFDKAYKLTAEDFEPLDALTQLTSLEIHPATDATELDFIVRRAPLSLQHLSVSAIDRQLLIQLTNLTRLETTNYLRHVNRLPNLVSLSFSRFDQSPIEWADNENITQLSINLDFIHEPDKVFKSFYNVKDLKVHLRQAASVAVKMTALEALESTVYFNRLPVDTMTKLSFCCYVPNQKISKLTKLKSLKVDFEDRIQTRILSTLAALKHFTNMSVMSPRWLVPQLIGLPLRQLSLSIKEDRQLDEISQFTRLQALDLNYYGENSQLTALMTLTRLTHLTLSLKDKLFMNELDGLSNLTKLQCLSVFSPYKVGCQLTITKLSNLTQLCLRYMNVKLDLGDMTKLKELTIFPGKEIDFSHLNLLEDLRKLKTSVPSDIYFWWAITQATALEELDINFLEEEYGLDDLATLPRLSRLYLPNTSCNITSVTKLSRLQELMVCNDRSTVAQYDLKAFPLANSRKIIFDSFQKAALFK